MKSFRIMPTIEICDTLKEFCGDFQVGERDLIVTNPRYFEHYFPEAVSYTHLTLPTNSRV